MKKTLLTLSVLLLSSQTFALTTKYCTLTSGSSELTYGVVDFTEKGQLVSVLLTDDKDANREEVLNLTDCDSEKTNSQSGFSKSYCTNSYYGNEGVFAFNSEKLVLKSYKGFSGKKLAEYSCTSDMP